MKSEVYRVKLAALGERELSQKEAGESLFEYAGSQFVETALPKVDANIPIEAQHQALAAHWREYETTSAGPLKRIASGLTRLETEMFRTAGLTRPDCPQPLVAHTALPTPVGAAAEQAARSLDDYAAALGNLARTVDAFSKAPIPDGGSLKAAAAPLKAAIVRNNEAYARVSSQRLALTLQLLQSSPGPAAGSLVCALDGIEAYQLDQVSPLLNGLLVNVIAAWRDQTTEETLADLRAQQQKGWRELRETLRLGAASFSVDEPTDAE